MRADQTAGVHGVAERAKAWADGWGIPSVGLFCGLAGNAWQESGFDADAVGDSGWSIGVFQCNRKAGLGRGHTVQQLQDPRYNTDVVLTQAARLGVRRRIAEGMTIADFARWFCINVERPADMAAKAEQRAAYADTFARQFGHTGQTRVIDAA